MTQPTERDVEALEYFRQQYHSWRNYKEGGFYLSAIDAFHAAREAEGLRKEVQKLNNKLTMAQYAEVQEMLRGDIAEFKAENTRLKAEIAEMRSEGRGA